MQVALSITRASDWPTDASRLSAAERAVLVGRPGLRRDEWIRGRLAMRAALVGPLGSRPFSILVAPDGSPVVVVDGADTLRRCAPECERGRSPCAVSLTHDEAWIAVAVARGDGRVGIDLCARVHRARTARLLASLAVTSTCEPVVAWAALEATLKVHRLGIVELLDRRGNGLEVQVVDEARVLVVGLGAPTTVHVEEHAEYVVAWSTAHHVGSTSDTADHVAGATADHASATADHVGATADHVACSTGNAGDAACAG